jgi:hypothetical protein
MIVLALQLLVASLPLTELVSEARVGMYVAEVRTDSLQMQEVCEVSKDGQEVFRVDDYHRIKLGIPFGGGGLVLEPGSDVNGDGIPDLVINGWSGGAHCCFTSWILSLGDDFRIMAEVTGGDSEPVFRDADGDPAIEVEVVDWAFAYWPGSFAGSPATRVVLDWTEGGLEPSPDLTSIPMPGQAALSEEAAKLRSDPSWQEDILYRPYKAVFSRVLDLLYGGYEDLAWKFLEDSWGGDPVSQIRLVSEFGRRLQRSLYFGKLEAIRAREMQAP